MKKHAYLIIAHNNIDTLKKLLLLLDDVRNDIYLHVDARCKDFSASEFLNLTQESSLFIMPRKSVYWGDYSMIACEMDLMKKAALGDYSYYHLLSGADLPIKTQDQIHDFFKHHDGEDFIQFCSKTLIDERDAAYRMKRYCFFHKFAKSSNRFARQFYQLFLSVAMPLQTLLHIDRNRKETIEIGYGANWFSLTDAAVKLVLQHEDFIKKHFVHTRCADELFVQTVMLTFGKVKPKAYDDFFDADSIYRFIDWKRGNPYVFQSCDFYELMESPYLFARKFDERVDREIIDQIFTALTCGNEAIIKDR